MAGPTKITGPDLSTEGLPLDTIAGGVPASGHLDGKPIVVVRTADGLRAVGGRCTHYGGPLGDGLCDGERLHCPWHHAAFDVTTGEAVAAPALDPIPVYAATRSDGRVYVTGPVELPPVRRTPPSSPDSVVIAGAGAAGAAAAETFRRLGYTGRIVLIGDEAPVDRPNLSKDYLAGTAPEEWIPLRGPGFYEDRGIDLVTGRRVVAIDRGRQTLEMDDGSLHQYGALLLAPGAEPRRLPIPGSDRPGVHFLRTLDDSRAIIGATDQATRAVVVGAGFIGLEVAASLRNRDLDVTVVALEEVPLAHAIGGTLGRFVRDIHEDHGVSFMLGRTVREIRSAEVVLDDGAPIPADLVVIGIGVAPRAELAEHAGLDVDDGIVVDDRLRTSDPHIWAAGDAARFPYRRAGLVRIEHWVHAQRQGQAAAGNILGHDVAFTDPPFFWSEHYDIRINFTGLAREGDEEIVRGEFSSGEVLVGYRHDGSIEAVASVRRDLDNLRAAHALAANDQQALGTLLGV